MRLITFIATLGLAVWLSACGEDRQVAEKPSPREPTREAIGHYCGMIVVEHDGPKGQIFLEGKEEPIWFSSVRDTLAFTMLPEEPKSIAAIYVNDMAEAENWNQPEPGTWVEAREAFFVVGSDARGGMGAPEAVPFSDRQTAERFKAEHGGMTHGFDQVPQHFVLGPADGEAAKSSTSGEGDTATHTGHGTHGND